MTDGAASQPADRYALFELAHREARCTLEQLWLDYLALGGTLLAFESRRTCAG